MKRIPTVGRAHSPRLAFTLVEMLALLAVVTVLASLMLPALARATAQTTVSQCAANLKQDVLAILLFAGDNNDKLPSLGSGNWPWDLPGTAENTLDAYGMHRTQLYDPGFPQQNIDQMWNYSIAYQSGPGANTNLASSGYRATGYSFTWAGANPRVALDDVNATISAQVITLNGSDPSLTATIPALPGGLLKIQPSRRVLVCDALATFQGQTDPTQYANYIWNLHTDSGIIGAGPWRTTPYGPWQGSGSPHLNTQRLPTGANEGMLDGHVQWYPWNTSFNVHTTGNGDSFWWLSDPGKL